MDTALSLTWFLGIFVSPLVYLWRAELIGHGLDRREFVLNNIPYFLLTVGKAFVWVPVLVLWLVRGRPNSPWKAVTRENGRDVRKVVRMAAPTTGTRPMPASRAPEGAGGRPFAQAKNSSFDLTAQAIRFGKFEFYGSNNREDPSEVVQAITIPLYNEAQRDQLAFAKRLAEEVTPSGGWAAYGADRLMWDLLTDNAVKGSDAYRSIMDASIAFLRESGVPPMRIRGYQWDYWLAQGGTNTTWLPMTPPPLREEARIKPLATGELRRVARLEGGNIMMVRTTEDGQVSIVIESNKSDDDPTRVQWDYETHPTIYDAYIRIGLNQQIPTPWHDPELEPFFPLPAPMI